MLSLDKLGRFRITFGVHPYKHFKLFDRFLQLFYVIFQSRVFLFQLLYIYVLVHRIVVGQRQIFNKGYFNYSKFGERLLIAHNEAGRWYTSFLQVRSGCTPSLPTHQRRAKQGECDG